MHHVGKEFDLYDFNFLISQNVYIMLRVISSLPDRQRMPTSISTIIWDPSTYHGISGYAPSLLRDPIWILCIGLSAQIHLFHWDYVLYGFT